MRQLKEEYYTIHGASLKLHNANEVEYELV